MFNFIGRGLIMILIVYLVALGLNVSNQGINQMTLTQRLPVIALSWQSDRLILTWQGKEHVYLKDRLPPVVSSYLVKNDDMPWWQQIADSFRKIWND